MFSWEILNLLFSRVYQVYPLDISPQSPPFPPYPAGMAAQVVALLAAPLTAPAPVSTGTAAATAATAATAAARQSIGGIMAVCPVAAFPHVRALLEGMMDRCGESVGMCGSGILRHA